MTDFYWPPAVVPAQSNLVLRGLSARFRSPFTGTLRTYSRPGGDLLMLSMAFPSMNGAAKGQLQSIIASLRGGIHRVWCHDRSYVRRGNFPTAELLPDFSNAGAWAAAYSTLTVSDDAGRVTAASHTGAQIPAISKSSIAITNGVAYALRGLYLRSSTGTASVGPLLALGATASSYSTSVGLKTVSVVSSAASGTATLVVDSTGTSMATGAFADIAYASLARCALINGVSQSGSALNIDQLPASTNDLLMQGDRVQIGNEMFIVTAPLTSNGAGQGVLWLHRPVRSAPADNAPVIIQDPMTLFMLAESENGWANEAAGFARADVSLVEAVL